MWTVLTSRYALKDDWIRVRAEHCVTQAGHSLDPYYTLEYPDFVHVLALTGDDEVILTRQYRHGYGSEILELPGGMMDPADASPSAAGLRELREETGYALGRHALLSPFTSDPAKLANRTHLLVGIDAEPAGSPATEAGEEIEVVRLPIPALLAAIHEGRFPNLAHVGMAFVGLKRLERFRSMPPA